jgi:hypothetical protein
MDRFDEKALVGLARNQHWSTISSREDSFVRIES